MDFKSGDQVRFADPLADGAMTEGTFHEIVVGEPLEVPIPGGGIRMTDAAWVSRADDGTTARVPYRSIRPA